MNGKRDEAERVEQLNDLLSGAPIIVQLRSGSSAFELQFVISKDADVIEQVQGASAINLAAATARH